MSDADVRAPLAELRSGPSMPRLGLGTWNMSDAEAQAAVAQALEVGYRLIDTAQMYGNEGGVGRGLRNGGVAREDVFVVTKLGADGHGEQEAQEAFARSAERLGLDYVDLYLVHWPLPSHDRYVDAWRGLIALREQGLVRAIGVSNFKADHIDRLVDETGVVPDVNQIQLNPHVTRDAARRHHAERGIVTQAWSPLGGGVHELLAGQQDGGQARAGVLDEPVIVEIAREHGRTPAQVVLRWHLDLGLSVVMKSTNAQRMASNLESVELALTPQQRDAITALDHGESAAADSDDPKVGWG
ncbi:aldo/keto reductase [Conexibacter sp. CPCC 206217]|uniref:aldo/keto reductase n=1 Tax=Conexibacter sp. CPCC 206217 TaxID=3064574 RepID=UPI00272201CE|nr:aldo/keto reductase [Conexibacter sp. CPCC 206217]MDO8213133.1 aldo/keto reductase [Conexibacter sp. CPCC 206217]